MLLLDTGDEDTWFEISVIQTPEPRSIKDVIVLGLYPENRFGVGGAPYSVSPQETEVFSDLLTRFSNTTMRSDSQLLR